MKKAIRKALVIASISALSLTGCVTDPGTSKKTVDPAVVAAVKQDAKVLLAACSYVAPIASMVVAAYGGQDAQKAMKMASASLGTLSTLVDKASTAEQTNAAFSALQTAWGGIDSAFKNDPQAAQKLEAIQVVTEAAKNLINGEMLPAPSIAPVPTPAPAPVGALS